jgi:hypothetical protein
MDNPKLTLHLDNNVTLSCGGNENIPRDEPLGLLHVMVD